ncbi:MAG: hypothetical protein M1609_16480, partial [Firmicutes bacterium]|nr:hypothetical protein [Bacillota bacterium]
EKYNFIFFIFLTVDTMSLVFVVYPVQEYRCFGSGGFCAGVHCIPGACNQTFPSKGCHALHRITDYIRFVLEFIQYGG